LATARRRLPTAHRPLSTVHCPPPTAPCGFTLLELLIALVLTAALVAAVWNLSSLYLDFFQAGEARTQEAQLLRSLFEQLTDDLASAIQDPVGGAARASGGVSARRFGLYGTANFLRVDVLEVTPVDPLTVIPDPAAEQRGQRTPQVPELKTVFYSFRDPYTPSEDNAQLADRPEDRPGLVRRELDFETPIETSLLGSTDEVPVPVTESDTGESATTSIAGASTGPASIAGASSAAAMPEVLSDSIMYAPEVLGLQFRYFDGRSWRSSWNSLQQKGLPVAVEMAVQLASLKTAAMLKRAATATEDGSQPLSEEESAQVAQLETVAPPPVRRVVVYLPGSPLRLAPQKRPSTARERIQQQTESSRSAPRISLQPRLTRESPAAAPEQWMRSSQ
jgi:prepilin-type N-terminal cleavage/methylation domain-containing protein